MKIIHGLRRNHYLASIGMSMIVAACIAGMVGCGGNGVVKYDLTVSSGEGGEVWLPGEGVFTYDEGTVVDLRVRVEQCYYFVNWTGGAGTVADVNAPATTITMNSDCSVDADFEKKEGVCFPDPNLETAVREAIAIFAGPIYPSDLDSLIYLNAYSPIDFAANETKIADLTGLEYCTSLTSLDLNWNDISDISNSPAHPR